MSDELNWVLQGSGLSKYYGPRCSYCTALTGPDHGTSQCPLCDTVTACADVSFRVEHGETLGLVGESGSGKSTLVQLMHLGLPPSAGTLEFRDADNAESLPINLLHLSRAAKRSFRDQRLGIVYQRPELGLNLQFSVGANVAEKLLLANWRHVGRIRERAIELMTETELPPERIDDDPLTFSGGMLQRVQIAKALSSNPSVLLLDEVTSGLDLSVQASVLDLIKRLQWELGMTMVAVSHDLGVIKHLARRTMVMKNGHVVESGLTDQILEDPQHPYTQLLVASAL